MSTIKHDMTAEEVVEWIQEHVTEIRMLVHDTHDPERFEVRWLDNDALTHVSRCQNLTKLAKQYHDK